MADEASSARAADVAATAARRATPASALLRHPFKVPVIGGEAVAKPDFLAAVIAVRAPAGWQTGAENVADSLRATGGAAHCTTRTARFIAPGNDHSGEMVVGGMQTICTFAHIGTACRSGDGEE